MRDVQEIIKSIASKAISAIDHTSQTVKEKINHVVHRQALTPEELAAYISTHPNTTFESKEFLGFQYNFYHLKVGDTKFYLETKGKKGDYILKITVTDSRDTIFEYHSYDGKKQEEKVFIPPNNS